MPSDPGALLLARSVRELDTGCLRWTGWHSAQGYARVNVGGRTQAVHRLAHELWIGPIPHGFDVDHVYAKGCRHRDCIEPTHLEAVTRSENLRRKFWTQPTCSRGHARTPENTTIQMKAGKPTRRCRVCRQMDSRTNHEFEKDVRAVLAEIAALHDRPTVITSQAHAVTVYERTRQLLEQIGRDQDAA